MLHYRFTRTLLRKIKKEFRKFYIIYVLSTTQHSTLHYIASHQEIQMVSSCHATLLPASCFLLQISLRENRPASPCLAPPSHDPNHYLLPVNVNRSSTLRTLLKYNVMTTLMTTFTTTFTTNVDAAVLVPRLRNSAQFEIWGNWGYRSPRCSKKVA